MGRWSRPRRRRPAGRPPSGTGGRCLSCARASSWVRPGTSRPGPRPRPPRRPPRPGPLHPQRRRAFQEQRGQREDADEAGDDEGQAAGQRAQPAADPPGAEDGQLGGGRTRQQVAGADGVLEFLRVQPPPAVHAQLAQQRDVRRRPAKAGTADAPPLAQHRGQAHLVLPRAGHGYRPARRLVADEPEQEADPGPQLGRHPAERRIAVTGRVGDAPVDRLRVAGKLRADLATRSQRLIT